MSDAGEFVDAALQREANWARAIDPRDEPDDDLIFYGASVGAIRGTVRDALRKFARMPHDEVTALSSELWAVPVFERRLAAVVLLQSKSELLLVSDLTRIEGFIRSGRLRALIDPLAGDVLGPLIRQQDATGRARADIALDRWATDPDLWLQRAAVLAPIRGLESGDGDVDHYRKRVNSLRGGGTAAIVHEAVSSAHARLTAAGID
ncbi:hypothetical protein BH09ACT1_BH09ACT1_10120 [soil metagenome]